MKYSEISYLKLVTYTYLADVIAGVVKWWISLHPLPPELILGGSTFGSHYSCESFGIRFYQLCTTYIHCFVNIWLAIIDGQQYSYIVFQKTNRFKLGLRLDPSGTFKTS
jgi:hypothetical protein